MNRLLKEIGKHERIETAHLFAQPTGSWDGALTIKTIQSRCIRHQMKSKFNDEQRMFNQEEAQGGHIAFFFQDFHEKGFDVGRFWVRMRTTGMISVQLRFNRIPIQKGEKCTIALHKRVAFT